MHKKEIRKRLELETKAEGIERTCLKCINMLIECKKTIRQTKKNLGAKLAGKRSKGDNHINLNESNKYEKGTKLEGNEKTVNVS